VWGPTCECDDAQLLHRGPDHSGSCASKRCALNVVKDWAYGSRCAAFRATEPAVPTGAPIEADGVRQPAEPTPDEIARVAARLR
jgi:hypothetical protein